MYMYFTSLSYVYTTLLFFSLIFPLPFPPEGRHHTGSSASSSSAAGSGRQHSSSPADPRQFPTPHPSHTQQLHPHMHMRHSSSLSSASEFTSVSQQQYLQQYHHRGSVGGAGGGASLPPDRMSLRSLNIGGQVPPGVSASRASFQQALDNPCEYFIDVM